MSSEYYNIKNDLNMLSYIFSLLMLSCFLVNFFNYAGDFSEIFFGFGLVFLFASVGTCITSLVLDEIKSRSRGG